MGEAIYQLLEKPNSTIHKILLVRPIVEAGENLGFLPGGVFSIDGPSKAGPYMRPVLHAMEKFCHNREEVRSLFKREIVEVVPLAYLRGCTFDNTYMILDEAQNTTEIQMKLFFTRIGQHSTIVISGDSSQVDIDPDEPNGLDKAMRVFGRANYKTGRASACKLESEDIMRNDFLAELTQAWDYEETAELAKTEAKDQTSANGHIKGLSDGDPKSFIL